jgi:hypothetical protein
MQFVVNVQQIFFEALAAYIYRTAVFVGTVAVTFLSLVALGKVLG